MLLAHILLLSAGRLHDRTVTRQVQASKAIARECERKGVNAALLASGDRMTAACGGDWIMNQTEYFPSGSSTTLCEKRTLKDSPASRFALSYFADISSNCSSTFFVSKWPGTDGGVANAMSSFYKPFLFGVRTQHAMLTPTITDQWSIYHGCEKEGLMCYFERFSECQRDGRSKNMSTTDVLWMRYNYSYAVVRAQALPTMFQKSGWFWFVSQTILHLWKVRADIRSQVDATRKAIGLGNGERVIGMHVRYG